MKQLLCGLAVASIVLVGSSTQADYIGLLDLSGRDVDGLGAGESSGTFASTKTFDETTDFSLNDVSWSDGGFSGVVDISFDVTTTGSPTATLDALPIARGGKGAFGIASDSGLDTLFGADEGTLTFDDLALTYVSGDILSNIQSVQFSAIYFGNNQVTGTETATVNGVAANNSDSGGDTTALMRNDITPFSSMEVAITAGELSINGIDVSVIAVPEPSTLTLAALGLLGLGFYGWRRRR